MSNPTNQQRIEQLEHGLDEVALQFNARLHSEISQLEDKMTLNQVVLETKHADLEKSINLILDSQAKMQDSINRLVSNSPRPQPRGSILGNPPINPRVRGASVVNETLMGKATFTRSPLMCSIGGGKKMEAEIERSVGG